MRAMKQAERMDNIPFSGIRKVFEEANILEKQGREIINLGIGRPDFDTPAHIKEAAIKALNEGFVHYTSNYGTEGLIDAIKTKLEKENGVRVDKNEIIVTVGANEAVSLAMMALLDPDDEVLVPNPSWLHYFYCAELAGAKSVSYPIKEENDFMINPADIEQLITNKTKMLVVNTPHNPTGAVLSKEVLESIADIAKKHNLIVISDEIYEKLIYEDQVHYSLASFQGMQERTLVVNGFAKAYSMTGWRIGFIAGPKPFIDAMVRVHQYSVTCPTSFAQVGAEMALRGPQDCVEYMKSEFNKRRQLVVDAVNQIDGLRVVCPQGAFYAFINIKELGLTSEEAARYFLHEAGIAMVPGSAFGEYGEGYIRAAFSNSYENIAKAMNYLETATKKIIQKS